MDTIKYLIPIIIIVAIVTFGVILKLVLPPGTKLDVSKAILVVLLTVGIYNAIAMTVLIILLVMGSPITIN
jgi:hypothetical protein